MTKKNELLICVDTCLYLFLYIHIYIEGIEGKDGCETEREHLEAGREGWEAGKGVGRNAGINERQ
jgi:hypothetical protein